jgi:hypothetical protein
MTWLARQHAQCFSDRRYTHITGTPDGGPMTICPVTGTKSRRLKQWRSSMSAEFARRNKFTDPWQGPECTDRSAHPWQQYKAHLFCIHIEIEARFIVLTYSYKEHIWCWYNEERCPSLGSTSSCMLMHSKPQCFSRMRVIWQNEYLSNSPSYSRNSITC